MMATLTRQEMEQVIRDGGSVLHGGRLYTKIATLPTEAQLAAGNPEQEAAAKANLQSQVEALQAQLADLASSQSAPAAPSTYDAMSETLAGAGFATPADVQAATDEQLRAVPGIGPATLKKLRAELEA